MSKLANDIKLAWEFRLLKDYPETPGMRRSILNWLFTEDGDSFNNLSARDLASTKQKIAYRYRILRERYLEVKPAQAYCHLINRLGALVISRPQIRNWVALNCQHQKFLIEVLQRLIQEMEDGDIEIQKQMDWVAQCTQDKHLREAFLLASIEEYCQQPLGNSPLLIHHLSHFLRRQKQKPQKNSLENQLQSLVISH
jgi:hypothetical protein